LFLEGPALAFLECLVVDEVRALRNQDLEDVLDLLVLVTDVMGVAGGD